MSTPFTNLAQGHTDCYSSRNYTSEDVATFQHLLSECLEANTQGTRLKDVIRRISLPATHPIRSQFWPQLVSAKCGVKLTDLLTPGSAEDVHLDEASCISPLVGYELSDKSLLPTYNLTIEGQQCLRQLLHRLSVDRPDLVYAPQLWPLLALFLHYHPADVALKCVCALLSVPDMLVQTKRQWLHHCLAMEQLGQSGLIPKRFYRSLIDLPQRTGKGSSQEVNRLELARWPNHVWKLPLDYIVRVVDCFLVEGRKVLFRAGLALWKKSLIANVVIPTLRDGSEANMNILELSTSKVMPANPASFLRRMFAIRNFGQSRLREAIERVEKSINTGNYSFLEANLVQPCNTANQSTSVNYLLPSMQSSKTFVHPSELVSPQQLAQLVTSIQDNQVARLSRPVLLFSSSTHGTSLQTLYLAAGQSEKPCSLLLVRSLSGHSVLGAFCSNRWQSNPGSTGYFGNGQCFLFSLAASTSENSPVIYPWVGLSLGGTVPNNQRQFQLSTGDYLHVGGGTNGGPPGLGLDRQLAVGSSGPSSTFGSPSLIDHADDASCHDNRCTFSVGIVELIGFEDL